jgi:hypothetical protein
MVFASASSAFAQGAPSRVELSDFPGGGVFFTEGADTGEPGNVGGGVTWRAGRLRGDDRFIGVQSKDDAPAFFGRETRYGRRVYGALLINVGR